MENHLKKVGPIPKSIQSKTYQIYSAGSIGEEIDGLIRWPPVIIRRVKSGE
jgi:hypothetical protein